MSLDEPHHQGLDWNEALSVVDGDRALLQELVEAFQQEAPTLLAGIEQAIQARNGPELQRQAHALKGAARLFSARAVTEAAWRLEQLGQQGEFDPASVCLVALQKEVQILQTIMAEGAPG